MISEDRTNLFIRSIWLSVSMLIVLAITFVVYVWSEKKIDRANDMRHMSFVLAEELRRSSDDLTRMVRTYVVTGNPIYKKHYQDILDIRNGKKPRPENYQRIYWDFVMDDGKLPRPDSHQTIPLLELMRQAGFTEEEFQKLAKAKSKSDDLTATELEAMRLVEATGQEIEANRTKALLMLHDEKYHQAKAAIMRPIDELYGLMDKRTSDVIRNAGINATILRIIFIALSLGFALLLRRAYTALHVILGGTVQEVHAQISRIGSGDFSSAIHIAEGMQNSVLGWLFETQSKLKLDAADRKHSEARILRLTKLYKALSEVNQAIVRMEQKVELFPLACRSAVEFGGMKLAWMGQLDEVSGMIVPVEMYGSGLDYVKGLQISSHADIPKGSGPTGTALRENRAVILNDYFGRSMTVPWQASARNLGWSSAAAFPVQRGGQPFAVLTVYHAETNAFDGEAIALLEEMSKDISFALDNFDRELQRKSGEESLRLAASVYESSSEAIMVTGADNRIISINPAFTVITGYLAEEVLGKNPNILKSGHHDEVFYQAMWSDINATGHWQGEVWDRRKSGDVYPKLLTINTVFNGDGTVQYRVAMFTDISQKREAEQTIWNQANYDFLTGLPNRQMFYDRLDQDIKKAHRDSRPLALLFIDLDLFKEVNDTLGHDVGDVMLKDTAQRLVSCVRETDTVARLGGDEFTVILGELDDLDSIERIAQDILHKLAEPFRLENEVVYVTASIGITLYPEDAATIDALLKNADQAMYTAKQLGRNRYHYFTQAMQEAAQSRMHLATELRGALAGNQFRLFYQPIVELASGAIHKAEALIRWQHPQRGRISPAEFIPIAEDIGLIVDIGEWVLREAAQQALIWRASYDAEFQISINKSPVQFRAVASNYPSWPDQLQQLGLPGQSIVVEITEGMLMDASDVINSKLLALRDAGIQVSLDDFGTGYSSLSYLKKFDIDYLKIDQSFTRNLMPDSDDLALCEAIIVMAHKLGMRVIAEGVETEEQHHLLAVAGCDYGQGYLFSKPVPPEEFEKLLTTI